MTKGRVVLSGVLFSFLKKRKMPNGENIVLFDLLICGKKNFSAISVMTTGELARETEQNHSYVDTAPFVNVEGRFMSGVQKRKGKAKAVIYFVADKVEFVKEPRLIPYKVG